MKGPRARVLALLLPVATLLLTVITATPVYADNGKSPVCGRLQASPLGRASSLRPPWRFQKWNGFGESSGVWIAPGVDTARAVLDGAHTYRSPVYPDSETQRWFSPVGTETYSSQLADTGDITKVWITLTFVVFALGTLRYLYNRYRIHKYMKQIRRDVPSIATLRALAARQGKRLPHLAIFIPAKNESAVIANTLKRVAALDYDNRKLTVVVIVDERELDEQLGTTTKAVVEQEMRRWNQRYGSGFITCVEVPKWYSGQLGSVEQSYEKSTKGRALNYALQQIQTGGLLHEVDLIGVLDADGRLDTCVLREVAWMRLTKNSQIMQGPVYQVSNFGQVSMTGIAAAMELAIHHMTELPDRLLNRKKSPQFLAGTNYFVDRQTLVRIGGWDHKALVEDADLALRIYIEEKAVADWLSWPEVEQTPERFAVYKRQRERWMRGHLSLLRVIRGASLGGREKFWLTAQVYSNMFRVVVDLGAPVLGWALMFSGVYLDLGPGYRELSIVLSIMSVMIWDFYGFMYRRLFRLGYIPRQSKHGAWQMIVYSAGLLIFVPVFLVVQAIPRVTAAYIQYFSKGEVTWYKTERTVERVD